MKKRNRGGMLIGTVFMGCSLGIVIGDCLRGRAAEYPVFLWLAYTAGFILGAVQLYCAIKLDRLWKRRVLVACFAIEALYFLCAELWLITMGAPADRTAGSLVFLGLEMAIIFSLRAMFAEKEK